MARLGLGAFLEAEVRQRIWKNCPEASKWIPFSRCKSIPSRRFEPPAWGCC